MSLSNLYRDLRDRRLLPVVLLLVVAILAVPLLLRQGSEPLPALGAAGVDENAGGVTMAELDPAIVSQTPELRAFRERLASFQSSNPFNQVVPKAPDTEEVAASEALPTEESPVAAGSVTEPVPTDIPTDSGEIPGDPPLTDPPPTDETPVEDDPPAEDGELTLFTTQIDVRVGPVGATEVQQDVREFAFLPDIEQPVVEFLFGDFDLTSASFVVSPSVISTAGEGKCAPTRQSCQFLLLEVGEEQTFEYEDGRQYRLELLDVNLHQEAVAEENLPDGASRTDFSAARTADLLRGKW